MRSVTSLCIVILSISALVFAFSCTYPVKSSRQGQAETKTPGAQTESGQFPQSSAPTTQSPQSVETPTESPAVTDSDQSETSSGSTIITTTGELPEGWPSDVPIMAGFTITRALSTTDAGGMKSIVAEGFPSMEEAIEFYSKLEGWQPSTSVPPVQPTDRRVVALTKGELLLHVIVRDAGNYRELVLQLTSAPPQENQGR